VVGDKFLEPSTGGCLFSDISRTVGYFSLEKAEEICKKHNIDFDNNSKSMQTVCFAKKKNIDKKYLYSP
jgi:hypothetical protein